MNDLRAFEDPRCSAATHPAVAVHDRDEWSDDGIGVSFAQAALGRYHCYGADLFQITCLVEQSQIVTALNANNSSGSGPSSVRSGEKKVSDAVVVEVVDEEDRDLQRLMSAAESDGSGFQKKFCEAQTGC